MKVNILHSKVYFSKSVLALAVGHCSVEMLSVESIDLEKFGVKLLMHKPLRGILML